MSVIDFIMEKLFPISRKHYETFQRGDMQDLVSAVIRANVDVVDLATDRWHKKTTETFLEQIEDELLAKPGIAEWYKDWLDVQQETKEDDYTLDNPRDRAATGTPTNKL